MKKRSAIPLPLGSPLALVEPYPCSSCTASQVHTGKYESCVTAWSFLPHWLSSHLPECPELGEPDKICMLHGCKKGRTINIQRYLFYNSISFTPGHFQHSPMPCKTIKRTFKAFHTSDIFVFLFLRWEQWTSVVNLLKNEIKPISWMSLLVPELVTI